MAITDTALEGVEKTGRNGRDAMAKAGKSMRKIADRVGDRLGVHNASELAHKVDEETRRAYATVKQTVQERPAVAVGLAAGAGLLLGLLLSSRRST